MVILLGEDLRLERRRLRGKPALQLTQPFLQPVLGRRELDRVSLPLCRRLGQHLPRVGLVLSSLRRELRGTRRALRLPQRGAAAALSAHRGRMCRLRLRSLLLHKSQRHRRVGAPLTPKLLLLRERGLERGVRLLERHRA